LEDVDKTNKLHNWDEFQRILEGIKERKRKHRIKARKAWQEKTKN
jgi:hypothetical protein